MRPVYYGTKSRLIAETPNYTESMGQMLMEHATPLFMSGLGESMMLYDTSGDWEKIYGKGVSDIVLNSYSYKSGLIAGYALQFLLGGGSGVYKAEKMGIKKVNKFLPKIGKYLREVFDMPVGGGYNTLVNGGKGAAQLAGKSSGNMAVNLSELALKGKNAQLFDGAIARASFPKMKAVQDMDLMRGRILEQLLTGGKSAALSGAKNTPKELDLMLKVLRENGVTNQLKLKQTNLARNVLNTLDDLKKLDALDSVKDSDVSEKMEGEDEQEEGVVEEGRSEAGTSVRDQLLNKVENPKLKNAINEIYRPEANVGDGGLADAVRYELSTGELVGGKSHIQKAKERVTNLENIIKKQGLSDEDLVIANRLLNDLKNALEGR